MKIDSSQKSTQPERPADHGETRGKGTNYGKSVSDSGLDSPESVIVGGKLSRKIMWIDGPNRLAAEKRFSEAQALSLPYIIARQAIGPSTFYSDGSIAHHHSDSAPGPTKLFTNEGKSWDAGPSKTEYFYILPGRDHVARIGTVEELLKKGLHAGDLLGLLGMNSIGQQKDEDLRLFEEEWVRMSRASFHLLVSSGEVLHKDEEAARMVLAPLNADYRNQAFADAIACSAGHRNPVILKAALQLRYDVNKRSSMVEATPLEHAENKGATEAISLLRRQLLMWPVF